MKYLLILFINSIKVNSPSNNAILGAQVRLGTSEAENDRKDRENATRYDMSLQRADAATKKEYARQYENALKSISPGEVARIFEQRGRKADPVAIENYRRQLAKSRAAEALGFSAQPGIMDLLTSSINPAVSFDGQ